LGGEEFTKIFCVVGRGGIYKDFLFCWEGGGFTKMFCFVGREGLQRCSVFLGGEVFTKMFCVREERDFSVFYKHVIKLKIKTCI